MTVKIYQSVNRLLKSILALSVFFLLLSIPLCIIQTDYLSVLSYDLIAVFTMIALCLCACLLIPIKVLRYLAKAFFALGSLVPICLYVRIEVLLFDITKIDIPMILMYVTCWIITLTVTLKESGDDFFDHKQAYLKNLKFFKNFTIFLTIVVLVLVVISFFVDSFSVMTGFINVLWVPILYFITELLLIRFSRDTIYVGVRVLDKRSYVKDIAFFGIGVPLSASLIVLFRKQLDKLYLRLFALVVKFIKSIKTMWANFITYIKDILAAIAGKPPRLSSEFFNNDFTPEDVLDDFGILIRGEDDSGNDNGGGGSDTEIGDGNTEGGGGGSGIESDGGNTEVSPGGSTTGLSAAGALGGILSESGELGSEENSEENNSALAFVRVEKDSTVYLKHKSYGDYNKKGFLEANEYTGSLIDNTYGMNYLSGEAFNNSGYSPIAIEIISLTGQYFLPDYMALGNYPYSLQQSDVKFNGTSTDVYRLKFYSVESAFISGNYQHVKYAEEELSYREFVYDNYTKLPSSTKTKVLNFLSKNNMVTNDYETAVTKIYKLFSEYTYDKSYNRALDNEDDIVVSFLTEYKTGICQHFASSSVVMFRALGFPARYVSGLYVGRVSAGDWQVVVGEAAHAWVEVYLDGVGWVRVDPTTAAQNLSETSSTTYSKSEYSDLITNNTGGNTGGGIGGNTDGDTDGKVDDKKEDNTDDKEDDKKDDDIGGKEDDKKEENTDNKEDDKKDDDTDGKEDGKKDDDTDNKVDDKKDENTEKDSEQKKDDEKFNTETEDSKFENCGNFPWATVGIVSGSLIVATVFTVLLVTFLKKKKKLVKKVKSVKKDKKNLSEKQQMIIEEEEHRVATQIIRDNYKEFIKIAGKNGIRKYPIDTTHTLRAKYSDKIEPNEAIEILTKLYRIARYDKNERLTIEDANQTTLCLDVLKKSFSTKKKDDKSK